MEGTYGDPQKVAPCGVDSTITYTPTNTVTTFAPGQTITLQWQETIAHDGWFRIALSYNNRTDLVDPATDPASPQSNALAFSKDASIESPPVAPVLVDGLYPHTAASITTPKMYTYDLKLPDTPCTKCTLQLIQFMNNHPYNMPGGYFYHHCADIAIVAGADGGNGGSSGGSSGAGASSGSGGSVDADASSAPAGGGSGGGCTVSGRRPSGAVGLGSLIAVAAFLGMARRRRA
jgi:uncharacterized membrane protein YgcG